MTYGIIFCSNSPYSIHVFRLQKKIIRTITNSKNRDSCRNLFKNPNIFTFISQHIFSLLSLVITKREQYTINSDIHGRNTRYNSDIHQTSNLSLYQRGSYHTGLKVFNSLPTDIKGISCNVKEFECLLKIFFIQIIFIRWRSISNVTHSIFYS